MNKTHQEAIKNIQEDLSWPYAYKQTPKYLSIKCQDKLCKFAIWFEYDRNLGDEAINIKFVKSINLTHRLECHC